jgi:hypothetical protein
MNISTQKATHSPKERALKMLDSTEPETSLYCCVRSRSVERLPIEKLSENVGSCVLKPPSQLLNCKKSYQTNEQQDNNGSSPGLMVNLTIENKLNQHRGRPQIRSRSRARTVSGTTSKSRIQSPITSSGLTYKKRPVSLVAVDCPTQRPSIKQSSEHNSTGLIPSSPSALCRFNYEDYKHVQVVGWLEGGHDRQ